MDGQYYRHFIPLIRLKSRKNMIIHTFHTRMLSVIGVDLALIYLMSMYAINRLQESILNCVEKSRSMSRSLRGHYKRQLFDQKL